MRLHPAVSEEEALEWLTAQAKASWGVDESPELETMLRPMAEAMAVVSAVELPEDIDPLLI